MKKCWVMVVILFLATGVCFALEDLATTADGVPEGLEISNSFLRINSPINPNPSWVANFSGTWVGSLPGIESPGCIVSVSDIYGKNIFAAMSFKYEGKVYTITSLCVADSKNQMLILPWFDFPQENLVAAFCLFKQANSIFVGLVIIDLVSEESILVKAGNLSKKIISPSPIIGVLSPEMINSSIIFTPEAPASNLDNNLKKFSGVWVNTSTNICVSVFKINNKKDVTFAIWSQGEVIILNGYIDGEWLMAKQEADGLYVHYLLKITKESVEDVLNLFIIISGQSKAEPGDIAGKASLIRANTAPDSAPALPAIPTGQSI